MSKESDMTEGLNWTELAASLAPTHQVAVALPSCDTRTSPQSKGAP